MGLLLSSFQIIPFSSIVKCLYLMLFHPLFLFVLMYFKLNEVTQLAELQTDHLLSMVLSWQIMTIFNLF